MDSYQWRQLLEQMIEPDNPATLEDDQLALLGFFGGRRPENKAHVRESAIVVLAERLGDDE